MESRSELLDRRKRGFDDFLQDRLPTLVEFCEILELDQPHEVLLNAERFMSPIHEWMKIQTIEEEDRIWITTRIMYFVGELLVQKLHGAWLVDERPESRTFGHYVVGEFRAISDPTATISPSEVAMHYVDQPVGRDLVGLLETVLGQLKSL